MPEENTNSRLSVLENQVSSILDSYSKFKDEMKSDMKEIKEVLLKRPSWTVSIIISFLTTISVSLIVFLSTK